VSRRGEWRAIIVPRRRGRRKVMMSIMISLRWSMTGQAPQIVRILSACLLLPPVPINWGPVPVPLAASVRVSYKLAS